MPNSPVCNMVEKVHFESVGFTSLKNMAVGTYCPCGDEFLLRLAHGPWTSSSR